MYLRESSKGKSVTTTIFVIGSIVTFIKLLLGGSKFGDITIGVFTGIEAGAVIAALGGVYTLRRSKLMNKEDSDEQQDK